MRHRRRIIAITLLLGVLTACGSATQVQTTPTPEAAVAATAEVKGTEPIG
jgi:hypothetical protein